MKPDVEVALVSGHQLVLIEMAEKGQAGDPGAWSADNRGWSWPWGMVEGGSQRPQEGILPDSRYQTFVVISARRFTVICLKHGTKFPLKSAQDSPLKYRQT